MYLYQKIKCDNNRCENPTWSDSSESLVLPPWTTRARPELFHWRLSSLSPYEIVHQNSHCHHYHNIKAVCNNLASPREFLPARTERMLRKLRPPKSSWSSSPSLIIMNIIIMLFMMGLLFLPLLSNH